MALMLLPHWTDGCIGSMEGLFFEASATTPYHFLMQSMLSSPAVPSPAQAAVPDLDIDLGVQQMQLYGVRYYLAFTDQAVEAPGRNPALSELGQVGGNPAPRPADGVGPAPTRPRIDRTLPWVIFEVADSDLVTPLRYLPRS